MIDWISATKMPATSGYYLCWNSQHDRPFISWFNRNAQRFDTKRPVSHWAAVTAPADSGEHRK